MAGNLGGLAAKRLGIQGRAKWVPEHTIRH